MISFFRQLRNYIHGSNLAPIISTGEWIREREYVLTNYVYIYIYTCIVRHALDLNFEKRRSMGNKGDGVHG